MERKAKVGDKVKIVNVQELSIVRQYNIFTQFPQHCIELLYHILNYYSQYFLSNH